MNSKSVLQQGKRCACASRCASATCIRSASTASRRRPGSAYTSNGIVDFLKEVEASLPTFAHKPEYFRYIIFKLDI
jgi:hypothetical protein